MPKFIRLTPEALIPTRQSKQASGFDLHATEAMLIQPYSRVIVPTGIAIDLPIGLEAQVRTRSGLAAKHSVVVLNSPGTIDSDYSGEIKVILFNADPTTPFEVMPGFRIAQLVVAPVYMGDIYESQSNECTKNKDEKAEERGSGGFGSTGI